MGSSGAIIAGDEVLGNRQAGDYTLALTDAGKAIEMNSGVANTLTIPPDSSVSFPVGTVLEVLQYGSGRTTVVPGAGVIVRSPAGETDLNGQFCGATLRKLGPDEWALEGNLPEPPQTVTADRQTDSYTLVLADAGKVIEQAAASANNVTVPPDSAVLFPIGTVIELFQYGAGQITVVAGAGVTIRSSGGKLKLRDQYSGASLRKIAIDEWSLVGDITT